MNKKARKLTEQITQREEARKKLVESQQQALDEFDTKTTKLQNKLDMVIKSNNPQIKAAEAWCRLTNALIKKYKSMTEEDPSRALKELTRIEGALLVGRFLTEQDLKEAL